MPLNIRFQPEMIKYVLNHNQAHILISEPRLLANIKNPRSFLPNVEQYYLTHEHTDFDGVMSFQDLLNSKPNDNLSVISEDSAAAIFYTSGTTEKPKGIIHTHHSLEQATNNQIKQSDISPNDPTLIMLSLCYLIGFGSQILPFHACGATCILLPYLEIKLTLENIQKI